MDTMTPRSYFVSVRQRAGGKYALLDGPYDTHETALQAKSAAVDWAYAHDPRAPWYEYGTLSILGSAESVPLMRRKVSGHDA